MGKNSNTKSRVILAAVIVGGVVAVAGPLAIRVADKDYIFTAYGKR
jgi:hypothetical protein